jgi:hypothetical protein
LIVFPIALPIPELAKPSGTAERLKSMLALIVVTTALLGQSEQLAQSLALQAFAGSWAAELNRQPLARLDVTIVNGEIRGQLGLTGMHVDQAGNVDAVIPGAGHTAPIFDVALRDGVLTFSARDEDDTDRFEVRLVDGRATLTFVIEDALREELTQNGIAVPRPITMTRVTP